MEPATATSTSTPAAPAAVRSPVVEARRGPQRPFLPPTGGALPPRAPARLERGRSCGVLYDPKTAHAARLRIVHYVGQDKPAIACLLLGLHECCVHARAALHWLTTSNTCRRRKVTSTLAPYMARNVEVICVFGVSSTLRPVRAGLLLCAMSSASGVRRSESQRGADRDHWCASGVHGLDDLGVVDACRVARAARRDADRDQPLRERAFR